MRCVVGTRATGEGSLRIGVVLRSNLCDHGTGEPSGSSHRSQVPRRSSGFHLLSISLTGVPA